MQQYYRSELQDPLYYVLIERIKELKESSNNNVIPLPKFFSKICVTFSITKDVAWNILYFLRETGIIEIIPYQGIKLLH